MKTLNNSVKTTEKIIVALALILLALVAHAEPKDSFFTALHTVESSLNSTPQDGDNGKAIGPFQIWRAYWQDAVAFDPSLKGKYSDCHNYDYAKRVVRAYLQRYSATAWQQNDFQTLARVHNGGPKGASKQATLGYWNKVQNVLKSN